MSAPGPPAVMRTAPPREPGTPTAQVRPAQPASAAWRARTGRGGDAPARTAKGGDPSGAGAGGWTQLNPRPSWTASPSNPASATSRFEPRPTTYTGTPLPTRTA